MKGTMVDDQQKSRSNQRKTIEEFIQEAWQVHLDRYSYDQAVYVTAKVHFKIVFNRHGLFWQGPGDHLKGKGCPKCAVERRAQKRRKSTAQFIKKAKKPLNYTFEFLVYFQLSSITHDLFSHSSSPRDYSFLYP
jgi:hypothetical protein